MCISPPILNYCSVDWNELNFLEKTAAEAGAISVVSSVALAILLIIPVAVPVLVIKATVLIIGVSLTIAVFTLAFSQNPGFKREIERHKEDERRLQRVRILEETYNTNQRTIELFFGSKI